ncbi:MAG: hypoxanthine phosphoribosyltransferase [Sphingobacteriales bacterium]|nr:MAG: hypoxanthine phosphoribosyltransferase [Sphingobacteriales bacterium]
MELLKVHDKTFRPFIAADTIQQKVYEIGKQIAEDYKGLDPLFIVILNGSFMFAADLFKIINIPSEISFIKLASYKGTTSTGNVITAIGLDENLKDRHIVILEDIIDSGKTLHSFLPEIWQRHPASVKIAVFLSKPTALKYDVKPHYHCRNLPALYTLADQ